MGCPTLLSEPVHFIVPHPGGYSGISRYCTELRSRLSQRLSLRACTFRVLPWAQKLTFLEHLPFGVMPDEGRGTYHFTRIMGCALMLWRPLRPAVATVHDLGPLLWSAEYQAGGVLTQALFRLSLLGLKRMDRIVSDSHATAQSLVDVLAIPSERIAVVHLGVDHQLFRPVTGALQRLEWDYGILEEPGVFRVLYVGSEAPRKNLGTLLQALALLRHRGIAARLIKAGGPGHPRHRARFLAQAARLGLDDWLTIVGEVPESDLSLLYSAADVFVLPSHIEGFGLPLLEAMACGVPVVCSDAGALPEVAGDAALLVPSDHAARLADAIAAVLEDASLRDRLVQKGLQRCQQFTWAKTAEQTLKVYQELTESGGGQVVY